MAPIASMTTPLSRESILAVLFLIFGTSLWGADLPAFAQSLEATGDWYRAIGVWKQVRFETGDEAVFWQATQAIVSDYWQAHQDEQGLHELSTLQAALDRTTPERRNAAWAWMGLFQYRLNRFPSAEYAFTQAGSNLYLGLLEARTGRLALARQHWAEFPSLDPNLPLSDSRSPLLAGALSSLVPGAGQAYAEHWFDGAQAFTMVGAFGFATYGTYLYDSHFSSNYLLTGIAAGATLIFEAANIYGAAKTADYFNQNKEADRLAIWEKEVFRHPLPQL